MATLRMIDVFDAGSLELLARVLMSETYGDWCSAGGVREVLDVLL